jgi:hypothetical protein
MLSANYLPPDAMVRHRWYRPVRPGVGWYYYDPKPLDLFPSTTPTLDEVDPLVRPIVKGLNRRGLATFASCQGHFVTRKEFEQLYRQLWLDAVQIRGEGLVLREMERGNLTVYQDPSYTPPKPEELWARLENYQGHGFLMFVIPRIAASTLADLQAQLAAQGAQCRVTARTRQGTVVQIDVVTTPDTRAQVWKTAQRLLAKVKP